MPLDYSRPHVRSRCKKSKDQLWSIMLDLSWQMLIENLFCLFEYLLNGFTFRGRCWRWSHMAIMMILKSVEINLWWRFMGTRVTTIDANFPNCEVYDALQNVSKLFSFRSLVESCSELSTVLLGNCQSLPHLINDSRKMICTKCFVLHCRLCFEMSLYIKQIGNCKGRRNLMMFEKLQTIFPFPSALKVERKHIAFVFCFQSSSWDWCFM